MEGRKRDCLRPFRIRTADRFAFLAKALRAIVPARSANVARNPDPEDVEQNKSSIRVPGQGSCFKRGR
jgi:hypothetical protein